MSGVRERKRKQDGAWCINDMYLENYKNTGAEFILGTGKFIAPSMVEVALADGTTRHLRGTNVIVSTGNADHGGTNSRACRSGGDRQPWSSLRRIAVSSRVN